MLVRLLIVLGVVVVAATLGLWWQRRDGRVRAGDGRFEPAQLRAVGLEPGAADAFAVLLGSPTCAPCATVRGVLERVSQRRSDLRWVYVDAADHLDLARTHHVLRVPTLFVLDRRGQILARTSGVPAERDLLRVLDREGDLEGATSGR
ncbi:MAG: thioredoxin family protein [Actinobacteria bacterium]|nr:thioredoxin family protein [Actinomycetota bacterium]